MLGVYAYNTSTGVVITRVAPRSPAADAGLERSDVIVTVDGFQVGHVNGQLYLLGDELQHRAGSNGRVQLLVQNWRDNQLVNLDVTLQRDVALARPAPRERE
jgi:S1-C subfamily serine protease